MMESSEQIAVEEFEVLDDYSSATPVVPLETSSEDQQDADIIIQMFGDENIGVEVEPCCKKECNRKIPKELAKEQR